MKDKKRQYELFRFYDRTGIQAHMEKMASQGWMLEKMTSFFWHYRRIEPKKIHFAVTYFPKASAFDPGPSEKQQIFRDFCEHSGWKLAASSAQMEIYYNEEEAPVPITTDALVELDTIHESAKKTILFSNFLFLILGILQMAMRVYFLVDDIISELLQNTNLFLMFCWLGIIINAVVELTSYYRWYRKAKVTAEIDGSFVETRSNKKFQQVILVILLGGLLLWFMSLGLGRNMYAGLLGIGYAIGVILIVNGIKVLLKKCKVSAKINRAVSIASSFILSFALMGLLVFFVFNGMLDGLFEKREPFKLYVYDDWTFELYKDELPLYIEDLTEIECEDFSYEKNETESIFLHEIDVSQAVPHPIEGIPELSYTITKVKVPFLYDVCFNEIFHRYDEWDRERCYKEIDASPWDVEAAYQIYYDNEFHDSYLICYEDRFIELRLYDFELLPEHPGIISEKLKDI